MATDFRARLDDGVTLPFAWFADPEIFRLEQQRIFARTWQYVGVADWVAEPGQYFTARAGLVPVVVVRDHEGRINGFVNICRHRASEVARDRGRRETLQCPYHAWTYGLDGCLKSAPRSNLESGFDRSRLGLRRVAVDSWGPLLFVNRDLDAPPLSSYLGRLPDIVEAGGVVLDELRFHGRVEWEIRANWKAVVENYLECYHCPTAHPGFSKVIDVDPEAYLLSADEWFSSQFGPVRAEVESGGGTPPYRPNGRVAQSQFHYLWPMFTANVLPGAANFGAFAFVPLAADRTLTISDTFYGDDVSEADIAAMTEFANQVGAEDQELVESIQRAAESGGLEEGQLLLSSEHLIQHFQRLVQTALA
jgi:phenylpropionate dioxygenase-like ring-hydroxylating dioxygenase large terminal subunit